MALHIVYKAKARDPRTGEIRTELFRAFVDAFTEADLNTGAKIDRGEKALKKILQQDMPNCEILGATILWWKELEG
jgi:hypothetical protein